MHKISIVIPMYNRRNKIIRALDSIYSQEGIELIGEIIVVDDGSTDDSYNIVKKYSQSHQSPIIVLLHQSNAGAASARNNGMKVAKCPYIAFLDSDDIWLPQKTIKQMKVFDVYADANLVGCNWENKPMRIGFRKIESIYKANLSDLLFKSFPVTPSIIIKKDILESVGFFDETLKCYEDCDYFQRICARVGGYYYMPEKFVQLDDKMTFGESGLSSNLKQSFLDSITSLKKLKKQNYINCVEFLFYRAFYFIKHIRRVMVSKIGAYL